MTDSPSTALLKTPLFEQHEQLNAKIVDFGGWALPVNYGSQIEEHHAVRKACGMFDVSHMTVSDVKGQQTLDLMRRIFANNIDKVAGKPGKALYSCMLNDTGGVIDDLIVYYLNDEHCRLVTNAGTRNKDIAWLEQQSQPFDVTFSEQPELALVAVQGPEALAICQQTLEAKWAAKVSTLKRFQGLFLDDHNFVGRTGYTGEDGVEFIVTEQQAQHLWEAFYKAGVQPCGLGARDTLRLESGMSLYGNDLDEHHTPLESGLSWTVSLQDERDFIGKPALLEAPAHSMIGLILQDRGVLRGHQTVVLNNQAIGEITSGTFSPTLEQSIALARVDSSNSLKIGDTVQIAVRNKHLNATVVKYPFIKNGKSTNK